MKQFMPFALTAGLALATCLAPMAAEETRWDETFTPEQLKEDFTALYAGLKSAHANLYVHRSAAAYDTRYREVFSAFSEPLSRFEAQLAFQRFAAFGRVAHARIEFPAEPYEAYRSAGGGTFPIYPRIVNGTMYVGEDYSGDPRIQAGDEIVAINGESTATWLTRTAEHISADSPYIAHSLMEFTFPRDLWAVLGPVGSFDLILKRGDKRREVRLAATNREAQQKAAEEQPSRFSLGGNERSFRLIDDQIAYLRPGPFYHVEQPTRPWDNTAFAAFIDQAFEAITKAGAAHLIIDLRENPGGDNSFSDLMLAWIADEPFRFCAEFLIRSSDEAAASNAARLAQNPDAAESVSTLFAQQYAKVPRGEVFPFDIPYARPRDGARYQGQVYALINRHSYSNAVNVAAIIQDYQLGIVAGEKTADMATTYGAMETFKLPQSGIEVGFPKAHIIRPSGDRKTDGVTPDWSLESPIVAGPADAVLAQLIERIEDQERATP
ncbi:MAG: S41 family peptidase [Pseudomonadota bacterium]